MQKKISLMLAVFLCFFVSNVFAEDGLNSYEYLKLNIDNQISFDISKDRNYDVESFEIKSSFFPQTMKGAQYLNEFKTSHNKYTVKNESGILRLYFYYDAKTLLSSNLIDNNFVVESIVFRPEVIKEVGFPITTVDEEYKEYLQYGEFIDIDNSIKKQASILAVGETDTYVVASKVAKWIREDINYDLSSIAANPDQSSTEVFESKAGVCREISNLFISMMRSLGIPARVVTGYAYTNSEEVSAYVGSNWGGHAWAEVLIGDEWVPFDLTYNQYGFVDATHIALDKSATFKSSSVHINASGRNFNIVPNSLKIETDFEVIEKIETLYDDGFDVEVSGPNELGFGSYGYLKVNVINTDYFYKILFLRLAKVDKVELLDSNEKMLVFKPNEEKEIYFRYEIPEDLDDGFIYTYPFTVYNEFLEEKYDVKVKKDFDKISEALLPETEGEGSSFSNNDLEFNCNFVMDTPENLILCSIHNHNNFEINDLEVCDSDECKKVQLSVNDETSVSFNTPNYEEEMTYSFSDKSGSLILKTNIPEFTYDYKIVESTVSVDYIIENFNENVKLRFYVNEEFIGNYDSEKQTILSSLKAGENKVKLELVLKDEVLQMESFTVDLTQEEYDQYNNSDGSLNWFERFWRWLIGLFS